MRIGYFGDGQWAHQAFELLIMDKDIEVVFVTVRYDKKDEVLIRYAEEKGIPVIINKNINCKEYMDEIQKLKPDLLVSMSFNQIFKKEIINLAPLKIINCHAGKLPFYRGRNILNWVLINDEKEFGITVHYVDEGIDTGDIIVQHTYSITDADDYGTLLEKAHVECAEVLYEAIQLMKQGKVEIIKQNTIDPVGMYCGMRQNGDEALDWNQSSREIFNFVRAICNPGPCARTMLNGKEMKICKVRLIEGARSYKNTIGQILGKTKEGFYVKTKDTFIEVVEYEYDGRIRVGDRFE